MRRKRKASHNQKEGCFGMFRRKVDSVVHIEKKLKDIVEYVKMEQSGILSAGEVRAMFSLFSTFLRIIFVIDILKLNDFHSLFVYLLVNNKF